MKVAPGFDLVDEFDAANLHQPVPVERTEPGGFGIKNYFTHEASIGLVSARRKR
jgi:hypothetical protein